MGAFSRIDRGTGGVAYSQRCGFQFVHSCERNGARLDLRSGGQSGAGQRLNRRLGTGNRWHGLRVTSRPALWGIKNISNLH